MKIKSWVYLERAYDNWLLSIFLTKNHNKNRKVTYEKNLYHAFFLVKLKLRENPYLVFFENVEKNRICISLKFKNIQKRKKSERKVMAIPLLLNQEQQYKQCVKWLHWILVLNSTTMQLSKNLFYELVNHYIYNRSSIFNYKQEIIKYGIINKYSNHYRW